jgi:hypothetical protein
MFIFVNNTHRFVLLFQLIGFQRTNSLTLSSRMLWLIYINLKWLGMKIMNEC